MHKAFDKESVIPIMFTSMFRIGEETGELSEMITKLADFYEDEVSSSVKSLTSIMEPLMIIFVAIFVGIILIASKLFAYTAFINPRIENKKLTSRVRNTANDTL